MLLRLRPSHTGSLGDFMQAAEEFARKGDAGAKEVEDGVESQVPW